jgi:hypothetical protein
LPISEDLIAVREDVAFIKAKIETLPDHETRIRRVEKWMYGIPVSALVALGGLAAAILK